jgi:hypothetical protein
MSEFAETPASIDALRRYFEAHEQASSAKTAIGFAEAMVKASKAAAELRNMPRPTT